MTTFFDLDDTEEQRIIEDMKKGMMREKEKRIREMADAFKLAIIELKAEGIITL